MSKIKKETKTKLIKIGIIVLALVLIVLAIYLPLELTGTIDKIDSAEELGQIIRDGGVYSYIIFIVIQFLQVTFLPLPAVVTTVAGTLVFGPWITLGLSLFAVLSGSMFAFFLGRKVGRKLVVWVAGEKDALKWEEKLKRGKFVFFLMMLFPIFPDDILCIVAGCIGSISWKFFITTNLITRPIAIAMTCFLGSGQLIPFSGWGIPVWIVLVILAIIVFYLSIKYQPQIENFIVNLAQKITGKTSKKAAVEAQSLPQENLDANKEKESVSQNKEVEESKENSDNSAIASADKNFSKQSAPSQKSTTGNPAEKTTEKTKNNTDKK